MKKILYLFTAVLSLGSLQGSAQLPNGSTVPDFTFTDINGVTQNLYTYLNQGKYVALDVSTTWCDPCWTYHRSLVMDSLYEIHDIPGDNRWKVLFIEADGNTDSLDLLGLRSGSKGNWVNGTLFPIINPPVGIPLNDFRTGFNIAFYPTLYLICPNKKAYQDTLNIGEKPWVSTWEYVAAHNCGPAGLDDLQDARPLTVYPNPANEVTTLYFALNNTADVQVRITNMLGQNVRTVNYQKLMPGDQSLKLDVAGLDAGIYFLSLTSGGGRTVYQRVVIQ
jgi:hypothetical protein